MVTRVKGRLDTALSLARLGYWVAPAEPRARAPLYITGLCENGWNSATRTDSDILAIWTARPDAGIGIDLERSGLLAIDCDSIEAENEAERNGIPATVERHSRHVAYLYRRPANCPCVRAIGKGLSAKIDVLTSGGLVAFNIHPEGHNVFLSEMVAVEDLPAAPLWAVNFAALEEVEHRNGHNSTPGEHSDSDAVTLLTGLQCHSSYCQCHSSVRRGSGLTHCPAHDDRHPSFNVSLINRNLLVHCHSGCTQSEVINALVGQGLWPESERLVASRVSDSAEPFPVDALPLAFQRYVEHVSRIKACPPEYVAVPLLVAAGTTLGNAAHIRLNSTWIEQPNLFAALIGDPGAKKTPAIQQAIRPVTRLQRALAQEYEKEAKRYKAEIEHWESLPKKERGPKPEPPEYRHVIVNDVTIEKLAEVLESSKGVVLSHDELAAWVRAMDQYRGGKGSDRQHYLSMWSGATIKVDRKNNPVPVVVSSPCLGVVGGIQPEMLTELADTRGRNDGFLDRLLWSYPDPVNDVWIDDNDAEDGIECLDQIFQSLYRTYGTSDLSGKHIPLEVRFSAEAASVWAFWYAEHSSERNNGILPQNLGGPWAKMPSQLARITLILHMIDGSANFVSGETIGRAVRIVEYFKKHARKVFAELSESRGGADLRVLAALKGGVELSQTEIRRKVFRDHLSGEKLRALLYDLEERGLLKHREEITPGRSKTIWSTA